MAFGSLLRAPFRAVCAGGLLAGLTAGCGGAPAASGPLGPPPARVDFGQVFEGSILAHEWEVEVSAPLKVTAARPDCGCTVARVERATRSGREPYAFGTPLAPGERLFVRATYDTRGRRGPAHRTVALTTDTGAIQPLTLAADVEPWLVIDPPDIAYARLREHEIVERRFSVRSALGARFGLRTTGRAVPSSVAIQVTPSDPDDTGRATTWQASVRLGPEVPRGNHSYPIELVSDVPIPRPPGPSSASTDEPAEVRTFTVAPPWNLQIVGPVALSTPNLEFGLVRPSETVSRSLRLECFDPDFHLAEPRVHLEPLKTGEALPLSRTTQIRARAVPGDKAFDIEVVLSGLAPEVNGTFLARLVVETGHPELPQLEALVRGTRVPDGKTAGPTPAQPR